MAHPESGHTELSDTWSCVVSWLLKEAPLPHWQLWALYRENILEGVSPNCKWPSMIPADLMNRLTAAHAVTFAGSRHLGQEPCGQELFGPLAGQGYDPGLTDSHKEVVSEFVRNVDNWVWWLSIPADSLCLQRLSPVGREMGIAHGGLLELAMSTMPNVVRELPSKVDVSGTFYSSPNRSGSANSSKCGPTHMQEAFLDTYYLPEEGGVPGTAAV